MIEIWPAIDIIDSQNVRLTEGDYDTKAAMGRTPLEAVAFYSEQPRVGRIHTVDLIGAKEKKPAEMDLFRNIIKATELPVEIGGGIRSGQVVGRTDAEGATVEERPVSAIDFLATVCRTLGIDYTRFNQTPIGRPIRIVERGANHLRELID